MFFALSLIISLLVFNSYGSEMEMADSFAMRIKGDIITNEDLNQIEKGFALILGLSEYHQNRIFREKISLMIREMIGYYSSVGEDISDIDIRDQLFSIASQMKLAIPDLLQRISGFGVKKRNLLILMKLLIAKNRFIQKNGRFVFFSITERDLNIAEKMQGGYFFRRIVLNDIPENYEIIEKLVVADPRSFDMLAMIFSQDMSSMLGGRVLSIHRLLDIKKPMSDLNSTIHIVKSNGKVYLYIICAAVDIVGMSKSKELLKNYLTMMMIFRDFSSYDVVSSE